MARLLLRSVLAPAAAMLLLAACAAPNGPAPEPRGRVWFCQGVDAAHPSGSLSRVEVVRDAGTLATATVQVPGVADVAISPGVFDLRVDGRPSFTSDVADGGTTSSRRGAGCPAAP